MTVNIVTSGTSGGDSLSDTVDIGSPLAGQATDYQDIFISHNAVVEPITDCALYITRYAGSSYLGADADQDIIDILGWGGAVGDNGARVSMTPPSPWTSGDKFPSGWQQFKLGSGDVDNPITLDENSIIIGTPSGPGEIPVGGEAHIQIEVQVPSSVSSAGYKAFSLVFAYSASS